jgi:hypothetical protein
MRRVSRRTGFVRWRASALCLLRVTVCRATESSQVARGGISCGEEGHPHPRSASGREGMGCGESDFISSRCFVNQSPSAFCCSSPAGLKSCMEKSAALRPLDGQRRDPVMALLSCRPSARDLVFQLATPPHQPPVTLQLVRNGQQMGKR